MAYSPSYQQYLDYHRSSYVPDDRSVSYEDYLNDPGNMSRPVSEEVWNSMTDYQRHAGGNNLQVMGQPDYELGADDPFAAQFRERFGATPENIASNNFELENERRGGLRLGYAAPGQNGPGYGRVGWDGLAIDPSRILWIDPEGTEGRRYIYEGNNRRGDVVVAEQAREADSGLGDNFWIAGVLAVAAPYLIEALPSLSAVPEIASAAETVTGAGALTESVAPIVTETMMGAPAIEAGTAAATAAGSVAPVVETAPGLIESTAATTNALSAAPTITMPTVSGNMLTQGWSWYNSLTPAARQLIGSAVSTGASAALASSRQRDALEQRNNEIEQRRQDEIRRGSVPRQTTTYAQRPLPGGLVAYNMGQGGTG